jgi:hypothetical protein
VTESRTITKIIESTPKAILPSPKSTLCPIDRSFYETDNTYDNYDEDFYTEEYTEDYRKCPITGRDCRCEY